MSVPVSRKPVDGRAVPSWSCAADSMIDPDYDVEREHSSEPLSFGRFESSKGGVVAQTGARVVAIRGSEVELFVPCAVLAGDCETFVSILTFN